MAIWDERSYLLGFREEYGRGMDTGTEPRERRISRRERAALLAGVPAFGLLPEDALLELADRLDEKEKR